MTIVSLDEFLRAQEELEKVRGGMYIFYPSWNSYTLYVEPLELPTGIISHVTGMDLASPSKLTATLVEVDVKFADPLKIKILQELGRQIVYQADGSLEYLSETKNYQHTTSISQSIVTQAQATQFLDTVRFFDAVMGKDKIGLNDLQTRTQRSLYRFVHNAIDAKKAEE